MPTRTTLEQYLFRLRRCAEKGDTEGMLNNLQLAVTLALEDNPETFAKVSPRTLLEVVQAQNVYAKRQMDLQKNEDNSEESEDFMNRLAEIEEQSDEE